MRCRTGMVKMETEILHICNKHAPIKVSSLEKFDFINVSGRRGASWKNLDGNLFIHDKTILP